MIEGLLDTHPLLWVLADDPRVPDWLRNSAGNDPRRFGVSDASVWEIAIKRSTGKLQVPDEFPDLVSELGFAAIPITRAQTWAVRDLPWHHRDPFDRLLVAQAQALDLPLITADAELSRYDVRTIW